MDPVLYRAAKEGDKVVLEQYVDQLEAQVTPNENTVLHIAAQFGNSQCVREILSKNSSLLNRQNAKGDTALHVAARDGHSDIVKSLIECATLLDRDHVEIEGGSEITKKMLRATNYDGDTALRRYLVRLLIDEDPEFTYPANNAGETLLYIAAERGYHEVVSDISKTCRAPAYDGPGGRTALHAAVISNNEGGTKTLLDWKKDLAKEPDMHGWTPLHYAARFGHVHRAKQLLDSDKSIAYLIADQDDNKTALHVAASQGHVSVIQELISQCPDCWEMVNHKGQNILHVAVENEKREVIKFIFKNFSLTGLINQKDVDGNTPLHLISTSGSLSLGLISHPKADMVVFNKGNWTPLDILTYSETAAVEKVLMTKVLEKAGATLGLRNVISKDNEFLANKKKEQAEFEKPIPHFDIRKEGDTLLLVATLVATVTFAAGFTMPGGYNSNDGPNQGMAVLTREAAFKAFVVTDSIAMIFSTCAVLIHFLLADYEDQTKLLRRYEVATYLLMIATGAMVLAFITGICAVLPHSSSLAIPICIIGCFPFVIYYWLFKDIFDMVLASFDVPISLNAFKDRTSRKAFS
ncbi:Ankyrin repeat-containing protein ITN1 [Camellia lanceoleosa]|nr:Ankyrin repeat-containing protein ITN1 [Camellia lanceoleosa]